ncbi:MAG: inositol monophosphatase [Oscillospiraceae bacterium]|nr:inositol monophosphatase [Oscillospiraceae bacterium]
MAETDELLQGMMEAARAAGELIRSARDVTSSVQEKTSPRDLVTKYDLLVQAFLQRELKRILPEAGFLGEEGEQQEELSAREWVFIVDPIDGTTNFIQGFRNSCVSIGLAHWGRATHGVVYNPYDGELYAARLGGGATLNGADIRCSDHPLERSLLIFGSALYYRELVPETLRLFNAAFPLVQDVRRFGSAALDLCYLAAGKAGAFFECRLCPWDYAAGSLIAREAGCVVTQLDGRALDLFRKSSVLAGSPQAYHALLTCFADRKED